MEARKAYLKLVLRYQTAAALSYMHYTINTEDAFYVAEKDYYDEAGPQIQNWMLQYVIAVLKIPYRRELEESSRIIPLVFSSFEVEKKAISPAIIEDMIEKNQVVSEYSKMMASMEFFHGNIWISFFGEGAEKYKFMHLMDSLSFLPYGTMVDEFQRQSYKKPDLTPMERKNVWKQLENEFRPYLSLEGVPYLEEGTRWQYQMHIYETPFYYIDYCLAQTAALQFLMESRKDYKSAFLCYVRFLSQGGEKVFEELLKEAGLNSPFKEGALKGVAQETEALLVALAKEAK